MREHGASMQKDIAESMQQSLQQATLVASAAAAAAATEATRVRQTRDMAPASHINLDRSCPAASSLVNGARGLPERRRASSQPHLLELALEHRVDSPSAL